jgi:tripartite-type tricarboxylate transporter receptor subunit TctC
VRIGGHEVRGPHKSIGMVFQEESTFPWRTVIENVGFPLEVAGVPRTERHRRARHFIALVGLAGFENRYPSELSGGMRQRVAIARTLAFEPTILLMDEPFASLDEQTRLLLGDKVLQIQQDLALTVNPLVQEKVPYDPARDFVPISAVSNTVLVVAVHSSVPARSLADLADIAKAEPGKLLWGSGPSLPRFIFAAFLKRQGLDMPYVPYRDVATPSVDLGEGRVQVLVTSLQATTAPVQSGKARIIAVANTRRAATLPDVPTAVEAGYPEMSMDGLAGFFGWRGMPAALRDRISADVQAIAQDPGVRARLEVTGQLVLGTTPAEFAAAIERQRVRVGEIARLIDLKAPGSK